ncbi:MAG: nucleoside 2-deoxyribosyltransferase [Anaerolineae bacterium]
MRNNTITICGSMAFIDEMEQLASELQSGGFETYTPQRSENDLNWDNLSAEEANKRKRGFIDEHLALIRQSDYLLIANYAKNGIKGYIGANTLMEIAFAYALNIPIFVLHPIGEQGCRLEVQSVAANIFDGRVSPSDFT